MSIFYPHAYAAGITTGTTVTSGAATANVAIPTMADGTIPKAVILSSTGTVHVKLGTTAAVTATANDLMVPSGNFLAILTRGNAFIAYIQEAAASKLTIAPCEY